jgi:flagellar hook-length control protein FliK
MASEAHEAEPAPNSRAAERPTAPEAGTPPRSAAAERPPARETATVEVKPLPATVAATAVAATAAAGAKTVHAAYQSPPQQLNLPQVAFEMVRQFQAGNSRFQIRLDPPELGRIDVRMDVDRDGNVMARMTVERSETLDLMQRDQRALERALAQAGLDSARTSLEFSLRHQGSGREQREGGGEPVFRDGNGTAAAEPDAPLPPGITYHRGLASPSGVNLFV